MNIPSRYSQASFQKDIAPTLTILESNEGRVVQEGLEMKKEKLKSGFCEGVFWSRGFSRGVEESRTQGEGG